MTRSFANNLTIVHLGDGLKFVAMAPDVCKTPSPGGPVPLPYPNVAMSSDLVKGAKTVLIEGNAAAIASSELSTSTGDEAGTAGGGIVSSKTKGVLKWLLYSTDVIFEGKGVVRFLDDDMHNGNAGNTTGKSLGKMAIPGHDGDIKCDNCGKPIDGHPQLKRSAESNAATQKVDGRTVSALVVNCPKQKPEVFTGIAGNNLSLLNTNSFAELARNFKFNTPIPPKMPSDGNAPAGNCAEQKALYAAFAAGKFPPGPGCESSMSAMREAKGKKEKSHVAACETCKRILTSMLCENEPAKKKQ